MTLDKAVHPAALAASVGATRMRRIVILRLLPMAMGALPSRTVIAFGAIIGAV
jgi:hypothetical protein